MPPPLQLRELAEAKEAELNKCILALESRIHWVTTENNELRTAAAAGAGSSGSAGAGGGQAEAVEKLAALESELRKSKRAEQKLQVCGGWGAGC